MPKKNVPNYHQASLLSASQIDPQGEIGLAQLRGRCLTCVKCPLSASSPTLVFGEGCSSSPPVCFIGEGPGATEETKGRPFVGSSGMLLDRMIAAMGFRRQDVFVTNALLHRAPDNRAPTKEELQACYEHLVAQVRAVRPKTVVALGASAVAALVGGKKKIAELRGRWLEWEGLFVMPTHHPSHLLRAHGAEVGELKKQVWSDLQMVLHRLGMEPPGEPRPAS